MAEVRSGLVDATVSIVEQGDLFGGSAWFDYFGRYEATQPISRRISHHVCCSVAGVCLVLVGWDLELGHLLSFLRTSACLVRAAVLCFQFVLYFVHGLCLTSAMYHVGSWFQKNIPAYPGFQQG